jgi:uncharacterized linocin/CFP29 family protein
MNDLQRELAPISAEAWQCIDEEAQKTLKISLAGRKLVDFRGPLGWSASGINIGRVDTLKAAPREGVDAALRLTQPFVEFRAPFALARTELDAVSRGAVDPDLQPLRDAAHAIALAEDGAIFGGYAPGGITGIFEAAAGAALDIPQDYLAYPAVVARALAKLRAAGVDGPYTIALGPRCHTGLTQTATNAGFPVIQHVERLLDGPVIWAPAIEGAVVLSLQPGSFELTVGRDIAIGFQEASAAEVTLYLQESFTFRVLAAEAAVPLIYREVTRGKRK